jgi:hypothetical protein
LLQVSRIVNDEAQLAVRRKRREPVGNVVGDIAASAFVPDADALTFQHTVTPHRRRRQPMRSARDTMIPSGPRT